ncbi:MAG: ferredoxin [Clostridium sp.]|nr:ferredoxin [Clostridium sp.]
MVRKIIHIDEEMCDGCGLCVTACHEGAIGLVEGKAKLLRDDYCDGLGNCLPVCPTGAITFEEREAAAFDETAVMASKEMNRSAAQDLPCGCPGTQAREIERNGIEPLTDAVMSAPGNVPGTGNKVYEAFPSVSQMSELRQWPVQIKLVPVNAPYFKGARLLVAADCTAYAYGNFHQDFVRNKITLIGCPKLDEGDYSEKLTAILKENDIKSVTVVRMEVPCCGGIENAVKTALMNCGKMIPWQVSVISTDGRVLEV